MREEEEEEEEEENDTTRISECQGDSAEASLERTITTPFSVRPQHFPT